MGCMEFLVHVLLGPGKNIELLLSSKDVSYSEPNKEHGATGTGPR